LLVAVDFADVTDRVVAQASALALAVDAEIVLIHVGAPDPDFIGYGAGPTSVQEQVAKELREEEAQLSAMAAALRESGVRTRSIFVRGATVDSILEAARSERVDWIVMGSRGGGLVRRLLGSVSEEVLHRTHVPVLGVPPRDAEG
jgi:nucleotide-binding universal stress UspA family protein